MLQICLCARLLDLKRCLPPSDAAHWLQPDSRLAVLVDQERAPGEYVQRNGASRRSGSKDTPARPAAFTATQCVFEVPGHGFPVTTLL